MPNIIVGGTFDRLHEGHKSLLNNITNFLKGNDGIVCIELTSDEYIFESNKFLKEFIQPYEVRKNNIFNYLSENISLDRVVIITLNDSYGVTLDTIAFDILAVSKDTISSAIEINKMRVKKGLPEFVLLISSTIYKNNEIISSTKIRNSLIDGDKNEWA